MVHRFLGVVSILALAHGLLPSRVDRSTMQVRYGSTLDVSYRGRSPDMTDLPLPDLLFIK